MHHAKACIKVAGSASLTALHQGVREVLVWGQGGVADQVQITGLTLVPSLMTMMTVTQDQQGGPEGLHEQLIGAGPVEG